MRNFFLFIFLLITITLHAQSNSVSKIFVHAYSMSSSTVRPIDTLSIKKYAPLMVKIKHPKQFISKLENEILNKDTISLKLFKNQFVRLYFEVKLRNSRKSSVYISLGSSLLYNRKLYNFDKDLKVLIRASLPNRYKDYYIPIISKH